MDEQEFLLELNKYPLLARQEGVVSPVPQSQEPNLLSMFSSLTSGMSQNRTNNNNNNNNNNNPNLKTDTFDLGDPFWPRLLAFLQDNVDTEQAQSIFGSFIKSHQQYMTDNNKCI
ncbi:hypothetical protein DFA_09489 [Cavenderia fasciculata]|uniref:Uncharacterized protein n=1 Tax=Cavenderia fasciculata TaxID=261658 RepID=F4Q7S0_CACFS|nr:uncharacterized protein DFA_09489 [Cavenderia fasciculata]EGG15820.1 hypothetical protein DFA_09489 [Cavenderia fasciculata]|eukprot:XP_004352145.1 hypothetical protein DFA_09489 [Cavenderia fasciculata]